MSQGGALSRLASLLADALKPIATLLRRSSRPLVRLWRLASLRSQTKGCIPVTTQFDGPVTAIGSGEIRLGAHCRLGSAVHFDTGGAGILTLGRRVRLNSGGVIVTNLRISIGDDTLMGEYVSIRDANHGIADDLLIRAQPLVSAEIRIGRDVWIGRGACILKGVTIGDGAVIGANSVVTQDVLAGTICVGTPARQIGRRGIAHISLHSLE